MLKLKNLENYQFKKENQNYFYIINKDAIYVINFNFFDDILYQGLDFRTLKEYKIPLDFDVNLMYDKTNQGTINLDLFFMFEFGSFSDKLEFEEIINSDLGIDEVDIAGGTYYRGIQNDANLIKEQKDKNLNFKDDAFFVIKPKFDNHNSYDFFIISKQKIKKQQSDNFLIFSNYFNDKENILFFSNGVISQTYVNSLLCSIMNQNKADKSNYLVNNLDKIDYNHKKIVYSILENDDEILFEIIGNNMNCFKNDKKIDCKIYFKDFDDFAFEDFILNVQNYYKKNVAYNTLVENLKVSYLKPKIYDLSLKEIRIKNIDVDFEDIFIKLENFNPYQVLDKEDNFNFDIFDIDNFFLSLNKNINGCKKDICNNIFLQNNQAYFFLRENKNNLILKKDKFLQIPINSKVFEKEFYRINPLFLLRNNIKNKDSKYLLLGLYGENIEYDFYKLKEDDSLKFWRDDFYFYKFKISFYEKDSLKKKSFDVIMSSYDFNKIPVISSKDSFYLKNLGEI